MNKGDFLYMIKVRLTESIDESDELCDIRLYKLVEGRRNLLVVL